MEKNKKMFVFGVLALAGFMFAIIPALIPQVGFVISFIFAVIALLLEIVAFSVKYYDYLVIPFMNMKKRIAIINNDDPFYVSTNGNAILVHGENVVYASSFVKIPVFASASEMETEKKYDFAMTFARVATLSKSPMRITSQMYIVNKDEYIKRVSDKLGEVQDRYNQVMNTPKVSKEKAERVKGEVTMWHNLFDNVNRTRSQTLDAYAMVTAVGGTEEEAVNLAALRGEEIAAGISSALGITASLAREEEILVLIEPNFMIPSKTVGEMLQAKGEGSAEGNLAV